MSALRYLRRATAATVVASFAAIVATPMASAAATAAPPAGLSIAITDHVTEVHPGSAVRYTATVTNRGAHLVAGTLAVTVPDYARYVDPTAAKTSGDTASWTVTIEPGKTTRKTVDVTIGTIPKGEVRSTTLATLFAQGVAHQILVRSADPDLIKGVRDPAHTVAKAPVRSGATTDVWIILGAIIVVLGALIASVVLWFRRRRSRRPAGGETPGRTA